MKIKKMIAGVLTLGLALFLAGCGSIVGSVATVSGNGVIADTDIPLDGNFDRIVSMGSFDVILSNEPSDSLLFQVDENVLPHIELDVSISGTTLYIATRNVNNQGISPTVFQFHVGVADLVAVSVTGSGSVRGEGVRQADGFEASVTGSGDVRLAVDAVNDIDAIIGGSGEIVLSGTASHVNITVTGSGTADIRAVHAPTAEARVTGSGEAIVYAAESLTATVSGSGDIIYHGDPVDVTRSVTGSGSIRRG